MNSNHNYIIEFNLCFLKSLNFFCLSCGDKKRLRQILLNLVNNAVKFTDSGNINIKVYKSPPGLESSISSNSISSTSTSSLTNPILLHFDVEDTGVGISQTDRNNIFKSFRQIRNHCQPNCDGVGLGLAICKKLCKLMGGDIEVKSSTMGKGTCMHFIIPFTEASQNYKHQKEKEAFMHTLKDKNVLLVDTQVQRRLKILDQLVTLETKPCACSTVEEALAYLNHHITFDICLTEKLKYRMEDLTRELKQTPIIYLDDNTPSTPSPSPSSPSSSPILPQPQVDCSTLFQLLINCLKTKSKGITDSVKQFNILVVEDNPYNLFVIVEMLKKMGYQDSFIDTAKSGTEAIQKSVSKVYDIILMDLLLPSVDGISATSQILRYYKNKCPKHLSINIDKYDSLLPTIIALTAMITDQTREKCRQVGMKGFLSKPIDKEELETMLNIITKRRIQSSKLLSSVTKS